MASTDDIEQFKRRVGNDTGMTNTEIGLYLDKFESMMEALSVWFESEASRAIELVDINEGSSSRKMGSVFDHALKMAQFYRDGNVEEVKASGRRPSHTRPIERA